MSNEREPHTLDLINERYGQAPIDLVPNERDPVTPALLLEASIPIWLHRTIRSLRGPTSIYQTPATSRAWPAPTTTGAPSIVRTPASDRLARRRQTRIAQARLGAPGDLPISSEALAEHLIIMTVLYDRRSIGDFTDWHLEAQDYIAQVIPSRRQTLQEYADMRAHIRRRRLTWKLAEHITDLDDTLDSFPPVVRRRKP